MNKTKVAIFSVFILIISAAIMLAFVIKQKEEIQNFTLVKESGVVSYQESGKTDYTELLQEEIELPVGSKVKTEADSYARVFLPDNSLISLDVSTEIQVNYEADNIQIDQFFGNTWHRVQTITEGGQYEVKTPNTIAAVRGTTFGVNVKDKDNTEVFVEESNVDVSKFINENEEEKILETINLVADESSLTTLSPEELKLIKSKLTDEQKKLFWYLRNKLIDEELADLLKDGKDNLRERLKEKLEGNEKFEEYRLGLGELIVDRKAIREKLQAVYDLSDITENTCDNHPLFKIQAGIDLVKRYKSHVRNADELIELFTELKASCSDGEIDLDEAAVIDELVLKVNESR